MTSPTPNPAPPGQGNGGLFGGLPNDIANVLNTLSGQPQSTGNDALNSGDNLVAPGTVGGAIGSLVTGALGLKTNTFNIILNNLFYALIAGVGLYVFVKGLLLIVTEIPGAQGVGQVIGNPIRSVASGAKTVGMFAATDGLSSVVSGAKKVGSVTKRKVTGGSKDFFLGPVHGPEVP